MRWLVVVLLLSGAARAQTADGAFGSPMHFTETTGEAVYQGVCAGCHMPNGQGARGAGAYPSLANDPRLAITDYPIMLVLKGRGAMPPFARLLSDEQVAGVVGYIRQNFGNDFARAPTADEVHAMR
jgi:mono/diheme cytochrome c family protein